MNIYFVGSIAGKKNYLENYQKVVEILKKFGHKVFEITLKPSKEYVYTLSDEKKVKQYRRVLSWINKTDIMVAECSYSSLGVGFEISLAVEKGKPVIVLYEEGNAPHFLEGIKSEKLTVVKYKLHGLENLLKGALEFASEQMDTRFNFFISSRLASYLDWISRKKRIPRAVYLRQLIRKAMKRDRIYQRTLA
jgi:hypothetical protein